MALQKTDRIVALIPFFRCEQWLAACLESLLVQTRPLEAIIVIDDGSESPPLELCARYPQVTLLHSPENVGPYRLLQQVIDATNFDAFFLQDADDSSHPERLERLLAEVELTGADAIGCGYRNVCPEGEILFERTFAEDANAAFAENPTHYALMNGTSLTARSLNEAVGGYATALRFGGDTEFIWRAQYRGVIRNIPFQGYLRLVRPDSLTHDPATGLGSPIRAALRDELKVRAYENAAAFLSGREPDLTPLRTAPPVPLVHLCGPKVSVTIPLSHEFEPALEPSLLGRLLPQPAPALA